MDMPKGLEGWASYLLPQTSTFLLSNCEDILKRKFHRVVEAGRLTKMKRFSIGGHDDYGRPFTEQELRDREQLLRVNFESMAAEIPGV